MTTFSPAYVHTPANPANPFECWGLTPTDPNAIPEGTRVCHHPTMTCVGGTVVHCTGTNNGHAVGKGALGMCYECRGKGYQTGKDGKRNTYYWNHRPLSEYM